MITSALREQLLAMAEEDCRVRAELAADGSLFNGYHPRMSAIHRANAEALSAMLTDGWPTLESAGEDGQEAAWLIVQHAIGLPAFQRYCLTLLEAAAFRGRAPAWQVAMLTDRIRVFEGRPQRYGTQFDWDDHGELSPAPIEDPDGLDERRARVGLEPLEEAIARHRQAAKEQGEKPPADPARRRAMFEAWTRQVGWRPAAR